MEFGAVRDPRGIDFSLPPLDPRSFPSWPTDPGPFALRTGAPMWGEKSWSGPFYPEGLPARAWLRHYATRLPTVEHNGTFYAIPSPELVAAWVNVTPPDFRLCPKAPKTVSHVGPWRQDAPRFGAVIAGLGDRLGPTLFQVPPEVGPEHWREITQRVGSLGVRAAVEVRHPAFFRDGCLLPEVVDWLGRTGHCAVVTDTPGQREVLHGSVPGGVLYLRFRTTDGNPVDGARMADWADRMAALVARGLREAWVFVHEGTGVGLLLRLHSFQKVLAARLSMPVPPPLLLPPTPRLFPP